MLIKKKIQKTSILNKNKKKISLKNQNWILNKSLSSRNEMNRAYFSCILFLQLSRNLNSIARFVDIIRTKLHHDTNAWHQERKEKKEEPKSSSK